MELVHIKIFQVRSVDKHIEKEREYRIATQHNFNDDNKTFD